KGSGILRWLITPMWLE
ncbi:MAG: hypothetical protein K8T89_18530, partial [Planctomycetes bacterium]|nr:hypothetical protein [Planctomycetota bacterium]